jgi:hypothetical protein
MFRDKFRTFLVSSIRGSFTAVYFCITGNLHSIKREAIVIISEPKQEDTNQFKITVTFRRKEYPTPTQNKILRSYCSYVLPYLHFLIGPQIKQNFGSINSGNLQQCRGHLLMFVHLPSVRSAERLNGFILNLLRGGAVG